jgi:phosphohistidine swiveling domain-containing protein
VHALDARTLHTLTTEDILVVRDANAFAYADWHSLLMLVKGVVSTARPAHHLTQVAREIGVPVIGYVTRGLETLQDGTRIEIDAATGRVAVTVRSSPTR